MDIHELTQATADHLAGRPVKIKWQKPPSQSAVGQLVKTPDGELIIYIADLEGINSRFKILLHELAHCRMDHDFVPISDDHTRQPGSVKRDPEVRSQWRQHPREKRAQDLADLWMQYAERNEYKYWRVDRDGMTCRLLALLNWEG